MTVGFSLLSTTSQGARAGLLHTRRGDIPTPVFMPVATRASFRHISMDDARSTGAKIILSNTYHLLDAPGPEVFASFGDIHRFMGWQGAVLTDSGGYQIFSLPGERSISQRGAQFRLPSGRKHLLTPESSIAMQQAIGSDIMMVLDVCVESTSDEQRTREAMATTHAWAERSLEAHTRTTRGQALFGIVQGGVHAALREQSGKEITALPFDGFAIGGLAVGETRSERESMTALCTALLPADKPRYLMGVGTPVDLVEAVHRGVDLFDCILPTKMAQQGYAYTFRGVLETMRPAMQHARGPLEPGCTCLACQTQPLGYIHHLLRVGNAQGVRWLAIHNIHHTQTLMSRLRSAILENSWESLYVELRERLPKRLKLPLVH
ncbi:MAG TPA: tRNA guanosine(34) transglycosylase Tgt [Polyangiaceae bacterium]|nr:tRNA guanosine(34) transglycosylase Tgt [Polyangiaceae bacterium]